MGDCHYLYGNHMTAKRIAFLKRLLDFVGLEGRLQLEWISSAEAQRFVEVVTSFTEKIRFMGPSPLIGFNEKFHDYIVASSEGLPRAALTAGPGAPGWIIQPGDQPPVTH
jgi:hypothetical protein